jgi:hypothetical protein
VTSELNTSDAFGAGIFPDDAGRSSRCTLQIHAGLELQFAKLLAARAGRVVFPVALIP